MRYDERQEEFVEYEKQVCLEYTPNCLNIGRGGEVKTKIAKIAKPAKIAKQKKSKKKETEPALITVKEKLSSDEMKVLEALGTEKVSIVEIPRITGLTSPETASALVTLELKGLAQQSAGKMFSAKPPPEAKEIPKESMPAKIPKPKFEVGQEVSIVSNKLNELVLGKLASIKYDPRYNEYDYRVELMGEDAKAPGYHQVETAEHIEAIGEVLKQPEPFIDSELEPYFKIAEKYDLAGFHENVQQPELTHLEEVLPRHGILNFQEFFQGVKTGRYQPVNRISWQRTNPPKIVNPEFPITDPGRWQTNNMLHLIKVPKDKKIPIKFGFDYQWVHGHGIQLNDWAPEQWFIATMPGTNYYRVFETETGSFIHGIETSNLETASVTFMDLKLKNTKQGLQNLLYDQIPIGRFDSINDELGILAEKLNAQASNILTKVNRSKEESWMTDEPFPRQVNDLYQLWSPGARVDMNREFLEIVKPKEEYYRSLLPEHLKKNPPESFNRLLWGFRRDIRDSIQSKLFYKQYNPGLEMLGAQYYSRSVLDDYKKKLKYQDDKLHNQKTKFDELMASLLKDIELYHPAEEQKPEVKQEKPKVSTMEPWEMDRETWNWEYTLAKQRNDFPKIEKLSMGWSTKDAPVYNTYDMAIPEAFRQGHSISDAILNNLSSDAKIWIDEITQRKKLRSNSVIADPKEYEPKPGRIFQEWELSEPPIIKNTDNPPELESSKSVYFLRMMGRAKPKHLPSAASIEPTYDFEITSGERLLLKGFEDIPLFAHKEKSGDRTYYEVTEGDTGLSLNINAIKRSDLEKMTHSKLQKVGRERLLENLNLLRKINDYGPNLRQHLEKLTAQAKIMKTESAKKQKEEKAEALGRVKPEFRHWEINNPPKILYDKNLPIVKPGQELFLARAYRKKDYGHLESNQDMEFDYRWLAGTQVTLQGFSKIRFYAAPYEIAEDYNKRPIWGLFNADNGELYTKLWYLDADAKYQELYNTARKEVRSEKKNQQQIIMDMAKSRLTRDYTSVTDQLLTQGMAWMKAVQPLWIPSEVKMGEVIPLRMKSSIFGEITYDTIREAGKYYLSQGRPEFMDNFEVLQNSKGEWIYYLKDEPNNHKPMDLSKIETLVISNSGVPIRNDNNSSYRYSSEIISEDDEKYVLDVKDVSFDENTRIPERMEYAIKEIPKKYCRQLLNTNTGLRLLVISPGSTRSGVPATSLFHQTGLRLPLTYFIENKPEIMEKAKPRGYTAWYAPYGYHLSTEEYYDTSEEAEKHSFHFGKNTQENYKHGHKITDRTLVGINQGFPVISAANLLKWAVMKPFILP